ncbi:hypothetical protein MSAN_00766700 [Mycena sanguinolenta]|uniref:Uncharacterized protein n=1 Tax=Mycena sanguinolenta TaxID=230812 RepID=A0A8H7DH78_9AGAR|nr:hypothetical protein MSAN_00766700 [Mycena sanguinolenta]
MQPLTRQQSRTSIFSWWSDRNPGLHGPTINLHAATKPLLRFMYHRQAAGFIEKNRGEALSNELLQVLSSYLGYKYVSPSTNLIVLQELDEKLRSSEESRRVMVDDPVGLQLVVEMLESPFPEVRHLTCTILGHLVADESTVFAALLNFGMKLLLLICDDDDKVAEEANRAFSEGIRFPSVVQAFRDTTLLDGILELLESSRPSVRVQACTILGQFAIDTSIASTVVQKFGMKLLLLICDKDDKVAEKATWAFSEAVRFHFPSVVQAFIDTTLLDGVVDLLESSRPSVRVQACMILGQTVVDTSTASTVVRKFGMKLLLLICDRDDNVAEKATWAFSEAVRFLSVVQAFRDTTLLDGILELLESSRPFVRAQACTILGHFMADTSTASTVIQKFGMKLLLLICDKDDKVAEKATWAFSVAVRFPSGAQAFIDAQLFERVAELLKSSHPVVRAQACMILGHFMVDTSIMSTVIQKFGMKLLLLICDKDDKVAEKAMRAFSAAVRFPSGAQAFIDAQLFESVAEQLESLHPFVRAQACMILGHFMVDTSIISTVVEKFGMKLFLLICDKDDKVAEKAIWTLCVAVSSPGGAQAFTNAKLFDPVSKLLRSPRPFVRRQTCILLGEMVVDKFTASTIVQNFGMKLLHLIRDKDDKVAEKAMWTFSAAVRFPSGTQAFIDAKLLGSVSELLESSRAFVRTQAFTILDHLAAEKSAVFATLLDFGIKLVHPIWRTQCTLDRSDEDDKIVAKALWTLCVAVRPLSGAQAFVDAKLLERVSELLDSPRPFIRGQVCTILGHLAIDKITVSTIVQNFGMKLLHLICDENDDVAGAALWSLWEAVRSPSGAQAFIDAKLLDRVSELLDSPYPIVSMQACTILGNLAIDKITASTALSNFGVKLVHLICDHEDNGVVNKAMWAFSEAVRSPGRAQAFLDAKLLDSVPELLESPRTFAKTQACRLVGRLASHRQIPAVPQAILESRIYVQLVNLLLDEDSYVIHAAVYALTEISRPFSGRKAVIDARALDRVPRLLGSERMIRDRGNELLESLFRHGFVPTNMYPSGSQPH